MAAAVETSIEVEVLKKEGSFLPLPPLSGCGITAVTVIGEEVLVVGIAGEVLAYPVLTLAWPTVSTDSSTI